MGGGGLLSEGCYFSSKIWGLICLGWEAQFDVIPFDWITHQARLNNMTTRKCRKKS